MHPYLLEITFLDVIWWLIIVFFWTMVLWMFIGTFADIFRRDDLSGLSKVLWLLLILFLPLIGVLIYVIVRPRVTPADIRMAEQARRMAGASAAQDIAKAQELLQAGAITQDEFEELKRRALA